MSDNYIFVGGCFNGRNIRTPNDLTVIKAPRGAGPAPMSPEDTCIQVDTYTKRELTKHGVTYIFFALSSMDDDAALGGFKEVA